MEPRLNIVTLGVRDLKRAVSSYRTERRPAGCDQSGQRAPVLSPPGRTCSLTDGCLE